MRPERYNAAWRAGFRARAAGQPRVPPPGFGLRTGPAWYEGWDLADDYVWQLAQRWTQELNDAP